MTENQLITLKKTVDNAKTTMSELNGHLRALVSQMKQDWDEDDVEEAKKKLAVLKKDIEELDAKIVMYGTELEDKIENN